MKKVLALAGKCVAYELAAPKGSKVGPVVSIVDTRLNQRDRMTFTTSVGFPLADARVHDFQLSKTCVMGTTWGNGETRGVALWSSMTQSSYKMVLDPKATDADLKSLRLAGDSYQYSDAGKAVSGRLAPPAS